MPRVVSTTTVDAAGLAELRRPRRDLVIERDAGDDQFVAERAPFHSYRRSLTLAPTGTPTSTPTSTETSTVRVTQTVEYQWALPLWWPLFALPARRQFRRLGDKPPWWAPPAVLDERAATVLGLLCTVSLIAGYLGTVITQTITFASDEFGQSKSVQGGVLALTRVGVILSLAFLVAADRRGRRAITVVATISACSFTVLGALSPDIWTLGVTQTIARGITTALGLVIVVNAAEELPAGARAYGVSVLALAAALGAGMAVWALPLADLGTRGWRLVYVIPAAGIPLAVYVGRRLPETKRFELHRAAERHATPMVRRRLTLLLVAAFLVLLFRAPASQLQNEFLKDERGFSASRIALFTVVTSTPAGLGVLIGGRLADQRGRRATASVGLVVGSLATAIAFLAHGWPLWTWQVVGIVVGSFTVPSLGTYGPEMFATRQRGRANGWISIAGMAGSAVGLVIAGALADRMGLGKALVILSVGPLVVAALVMLYFPETANIELEALNPEDGVAPAPVPYTERPIDRLG